MRSGMIALVLGLLSLRLLPVLPPPWLLGLLVLLAVGLLFTRINRIGWFVLGLAWTCASAQLALDDRLAPELDGRTLWLQGQVVGLAQQDDGVVRFELAHPVSRRALLPQKIRLSWYGQHSVVAGEIWRLAVRLKRPHGLVNPQVFDYETWLLAQRIGATGSVKDGQRIAPASGLGSWRDRLRKRLLATPANGREAMLSALVVGDGSAIAPADWATLKATGTVHLLVISGTHIGLLAGLLYALVAGLARIGWWPQAIPWLPCACALALCGALVYGFLAGFQVPVQRACAMVGLVLLWRLRFRRIGASYVLLFALIVVLLNEPLASLQAGFWLSFSAVALLMLIFSGRLGGWSWGQSLVRAQWAIALGLLPMMLALGLPVSLSGPLANLVAVPLVGLVIVPLALAGSLLLPVPYVGTGLLWLAGGLVEILFRGLTPLAHWLPAWQPGTYGLGVWLLACAGTLLLLLPSGLPLRLFGWPLMLPLLFTTPQKIAEGTAVVTMLDVGQGLAVVVRTRNHALLYDAAPRFGDFDLGERVVLPSLRALNIEQLDLLLLSHGDNDHIGGASAVIEGMPVEHVISGEAGRLPSRWQAQPCRQRSWRWDGVTLQSWRWADASDANQASCVLIIEAQGERIVLTGDIDVAAESALLASGLELEARWLLSAHHGSRSSSSRAFVQRVAPQAVLISRGKHNAFGHPAPDVLARYAQIPARVYDTVAQGAVTVQLGQFTDAKTLRTESRFWREK